MKPVVWGVVAPLVAIVVFVLRTEYRDWGQRLAKVLVTFACRSLDEPLRSRRREEWEAELLAVWRDPVTPCTGLSFAGYLALRYGTLGWLRKLWATTPAAVDGPALLSPASCEATAAMIREFHLSSLPDLLQTPEFARIRIDAERHTYSPWTDPDAWLAALVKRQFVFRRSTGPRYEVILDELALRRGGAPHEVLKAQLYHLAAVASADPRITLRILPIDARIEGYLVPRAAFSIYTFSDSNRPGVVVVDVPSSDLLMDSSASVSYYEEFYDRLRSASLTRSDSLELHRHGEVGG